MVEVHVRPARVSIFTPYSPSSINTNILCDQSLIMSKDHRASLMCAKDELAKLLTYHQVMPSFVDLICTFQFREEPLHYALFRRENYLDRDSPTLRVPHLGRSGIQIQHAFNLLTVERSDRKDELNPWPLRHATLYHSLDLETGRAVYISMKGNPELVNRMREAGHVNRHMLPTTPRTREKSFIASLQVHLIMLEWCGENWNEYIEEKAVSIHKSSTRVKIASVDEVVAPANLAATLQRRRSTLPRHRGVGRQASWVSAAPSWFSRHDSIAEEGSEGQQPPSPSQDLPPSPTRSASGRSFSTFMRRVTSGLGNERDGQEQDALDATTEQQKQEDETLMARLATLEERFSSTQLQALSWRSREIGRSLVAIEQTVQVLSQVEEQYRTVIASHAYNTLLDTKQCESEVAAFFRRLHNLQGDLALYRRRLQDLASRVDDDKHLLESLSQNTGIQTSKAFQLVAQTSTDQMMKWTVEMREIAIKTKQETLSMHVITIFTLIFLPGTFIAVSLTPLLSFVPKIRNLTSHPFAQTLFSSGVLRWDEDGTLGSDWVVRNDGLRLFVSICVPLTIVTISIWAAMYSLARRWARKHARITDGPGYADERGVVDATGNSVNVNGAIKGGSSGVWPASPGAPITPTTPVTPGVAVSEKQRGVVGEKAA
ncbi:uncharacterized protein C8A04DRAFT_14831 [Dichotomopilus funicola]|uniref:CorA-like transporter domain-containing protein n=1 Tax=Dichotomopilus funicola TaxID=1934379 RepID=A0AAN6UX46_9PEZI|nr:hypothetical protein C8A04DRAFT_14831 [Dichotomopilus funicola]